MVKITAGEFQVLAKLIYSLSGIHLDDSKQYLVENRLANLLQELGCQNFTEFHAKARLDQAIQKRIIDAITTGETLFFRDSSPFELLQHKILPDLIDKRTKRAGSLPPLIRVWSAACSSGQEVYSIAIILRELLGDLSRYNIKLLGTDISDEAVARASYGRYNRFEIERGLPKDKLVKYFNIDKDAWRIKDEVRAMATFRRYNLMDSLLPLGKFDIVFCRNVAIYFNDADRAKVFGKIGQVMEPDGYLVIGSTESLSGICPQFQPNRYLRSVYYQLGNSPQTGLSSQSSQPSLTRPGRP